MLCVVLLSCSIGVDEAHGQRFVLKTREAGFDNGWDGSGVAVADYDMDGDLDLYFVGQKAYDPFNPRSWNRLFRNNGDKTFTDVALEAGVRGENIPPTPHRVFGTKFSSSWADYDGDGDPDLFLTNIGPEVLFRNNGDGTFDDVTEQSGLQALGEYIENSASLWWDFDLDGDLDVFISSWSGKNRHYRNLGDGTFENLSVVSGLDVDVRTWMSMTLDMDENGLPDLYLVNDFGPNLLFLQQTDGSWVESSSTYEIGNNKESMGAAFGDANNDGLFDIFITNNAIHTHHLNSFYQASSAPPYFERGVELGLGETDWGWGTEFFDVDHDGDLELFAVNGSALENDTINRLFNNLLVENGVLEFEDVSESSGTDGLAESHGLVVFDYDDDGDLDMLVSNWREPLYLYENVTVTGNWLKVNLSGTTSNRNGVGAKLRLTTEDGVYHRLNDGVDFLGQSIQPVHFGLGSSSKANELLITWPNGNQEVFFDVAANQLFEIVEGSGFAVSTEDQLPHKMDFVASLYPNPVSDSAILRVVAPRTGTYNVEIFDALGRRVSVSSELLTADQQLDIDIHVDDAQPGVYLYRFVDNNGRHVVSGSFVKIR